MDPFVQAQLIIALFGAAALGVHWFFMRGYNRERRKRGD